MSVLGYMQIINKHRERGSPRTEEQKLKLSYKYLQRVLSKGET